MALWSVAACTFASCCLTLKNADSARKICCWFVVIEICRLAKSFGSSTAFKLGLGRKKYQRIQKDLRGLHWANLNLFWIQSIDQHFGTAIAVAQLHVGVSHSSGRCSAYFPPGLFGFFWGKRDEQLWMWPDTGRCDAYTVEFFRIFEHMLFRNRLQGVLFVFLFNLAISFKVCKASWIFSLSSLYAFHIFSCWGQDIPDQIRHQLEMQLDKTINRGQSRDTDAKVVMCRCGQAVSSSVLSRCVGNWEVTVTSDSLRTKSTLKPGRKVAERTVKKAGLVSQFWWFLLLWEHISFLTPTDMDRFGHHHNY